MARYEEYEQLEAGREAPSVSPLPVPPPQHGRTLRKVAVLGAAAIGAAVVCLHAGSPVETQMGDSLVKLASEPSSRKCVDDSMMYFPDIPGHGATHEKDPEACNQRCRGITGCAHWHFMGATKDHKYGGTCKVQNKDAHKGFRTPWGVGGKPCSVFDKFLQSMRDQKLAAAEQRAEMENPDAVKMMNKYCVKEDVAVKTLDCPGTSGQRVKDKEGCRELCAKTPGCEMWTYFSQIGTCHTGAGGDTMSVPGASVGDPKCEAEQMKKEKKYIKENKKKVPEPEKPVQLPEKKIPSTTPCKTMEPPKIPTPEPPIIEVPEKMTTMEPPAVVTPEKITTMEPPVLEEPEKTTPCTTTPEPTTTTPCTK